MAAADAGSQLSFHLNENPRPALSDYARWKMPISGLDLIDLNPKPELLIPILFSLHNIVLLLNLYFHVTL